MSMLRNAWWWWWRRPVVEAPRRRVWGEGTEEEWVKGRAAAFGILSGVSVTRETALGWSPVWRAVNLISRDVAKLPLFVYRRLQPEGKERATQHPAYRLLWAKANREMTAYKFRKQMQTHALLAGNAYALIVRDGAGSPRELIPLLPENVDPMRDEPDSPLYYKLTMGTTEERIEARNMLHVDGCGWDGLQGWDTICQGKDTIGMGIAARDYGAAFFGNGARHGIAITHPNTLSDTAKQHLLESWESAHRGIAAAHKAVILEEGMQTRQISDTAEDAQLIETRVHEIREAANLFNVPSRKLGDPEPQSYNSLEQDNQDYLSSCLDGWLCAWEAECYDKLLTERQKQSDSHVIEFLRAALVAADIKTRMEAYQIAIMNGIMAPNEARARENMNPKEGGDKLFMASNVMPIEDVGKQPDPVVVQEDEPEEPDNGAVDEVTRQAAHRLFSRLWAKASGAAKRPGSFVEFVERLHDTESEKAMDIMGPSMRLTGRDPLEATRALGVFSEALLDLAGQAKPSNLVATLDGQKPEIERSFMEALQ